MAGKTLLFPLLFLFLNKFYADSTEIYSAYLRSEIRGTLSHISENGYYSTLGKHNSFTICFGV